MKIIHNTGSIKTRQEEENRSADLANACLLYTSPSPRDRG